MSAAKAVRHPARGSRPQVLVLGGGFAGIGAAQKLRKHEVDVVIVDGHDYHTFQPLLYQVATDLLPPVTVGHPLRDLFDDQPNARVHTTEVTSVDLEKRRAEFAEMDPLNYDYLVLALGARVNFFGVKGASEHAFPLYTLADAVRLKEHILERWEAADKDPDLIGDGALNIVVVGGGPTGWRALAPSPSSTGRSSSRTTPTFPRRRRRSCWSRRARRSSPCSRCTCASMRRRRSPGGTSRSACGEVVESVTATRVTLKSGRVIPAHTLVWGAGCRRTRSPPRWA